MKCVWKCFAKSNFKTIRSVIIIFLSDGIPQTIFSSMYTAHIVCDVYPGILKEKKLLLSGPIAWGIYLYNSI